MIEYFTYEYGHTILNIMKYFNLVCLSVIVLLLLYTALRKNNHKVDIDNKLIYIGLFLVIAVAIVLRIYRLDTIPIDIAPDEASVYYDALCLANYGTNRWGEINAVYFNTWEIAGQSPAMANIALVFLKIFGNSLFVFRLSQAVPAIITVVLAFFIGKKLFTPFVGLVASAVLAVSPWHIMMSRWALDCNMSAFAVTAAICAFIYSFNNDGSMNRFFYLFSVMAGFSLYTYATTNVMMFVTIVLLYFYILIKKRINWRIFIPANILLFVIAAPMMYFFAVNYLGLPPLETDFLTIPYLRGFRSDDVSADIITNLIASLSHIYKTGDRVVFYPQFSIMYVISLPFFIFGLLKAIRKHKETYVLLFWLLGSMVQLGVVKNSGVWGIVNFAVVLPYFIAYSINDVIANKKGTAFIISAMYAVSLLMFVYTYVAVLPEESGVKIGAGTKDAIQFAQEIDAEKIYFTGYNGTSDAFIFSALNNQHSPEEYREKLIVNPEMDEWQYIKQYDNIIFYEDLYSHSTDENVAFILFNYLDNIQYFQDMGYSIKTFRSFSVAYKEQ